MDDNKRRQIRNCFRQAMNADLSNSMRERGLIYKLNFGVPSPRIKLIAEQFEPNAADAMFLWREDVRESKMLATYLFPKEEMTPALAQEWVSTVCYPEIADQVCMNLFADLSFAGKLASEWICSSEEMTVYTGLRLWVRLFMTGRYPEATDVPQLLQQLKKQLTVPTVFIRQAAMSLAEKMSDAPGEWRTQLSDTLSDWKQAQDIALSDMYHFICYWDEV